MKGNNILSIAGIFLLGGLVGAGVALLTAPMSGPETRARLMNKSTEIKDKAIDTADSTRKRAKDALEDISSQTKEKVSSIRHRSEDVLHDATEQIRDKAESVRKSASR